MLASDDIDDNESEYTDVELGPEASTVASSTGIPPGDRIQHSKHFLPIWAKPPWPEWSDSVINRETWEENESVEVFEDPAGAIEPQSISPLGWMRPSELFVEPPKLVDWTVPTIDLITPNAHLCELSEAIRFILSEISELYDYGTTNEFQVEGEGTAFNTNSERQGVSWKPWDHIYSCCKAGVQGERPVFNQMGKYYVRLYFMGCWRRITVDDRIPLLQNGQIGLPVTSKNELWPMILTKALLKISCLTWKDDSGSSEIVNFSSISALTGWNHEWIDVRESVQSEALWNELTDILPKYKRPVIAAAGKKSKERRTTDKTDDEGLWLWWNADAVADDNGEEEEAEFQDNSELNETTEVPIVDEEALVSPPPVENEHPHKHKKKVLKKKKDKRISNKKDASLTKIKQVTSEAEQDKEEVVKKDKKKGKKGPANIKDDKKTKAVPDAEQNEGTDKKKRKKSVVNKKSSIKKKSKATSEGGQEKETTKDEKKKSKNSIDNGKKNVGKISKGALESELEDEPDKKKKKSKTVENKKDVTPGLKSIEPVSENEQDDKKPKKKSLTNKRRKSKAVSDGELEDASKDKKTKDEPRRSKSLGDKKEKIMDDSETEQEPGSNENETDKKDKKKRKKSLVNKKDVTPGKKASRPVSESELEEDDLNKDKKKRRKSIGNKKDGIKSQAVSEGEEEVSNNNEDNKKDKNKRKKSVDNKKDSKKSEAASENELEGETVKEDKKKRKKSVSSKKRVTASESELDEETVNKKDKKKKRPSNKSGGKTSHAASDTELEEIKVDEKSVKKDKKTKKDKQEASLRANSNEKSIGKEGKKSKKVDKEGPLKDKKASAHIDTEGLPDDEQHEDSAGNPAQDKKLSKSKNKKKEDATTGKKVEDKKRKGSKNKNQKKSSAAESNVKHKKKNEADENTEETNQPMDAEEKQEPLVTDAVNANKKEASADFNAVEFKKTLMEKLAKLNESKRDEHRTKSNESLQRKVPRMQDILKGVQQYSGMEHYSLLSTWEAICGKNVPVALTVVLKLCPKPEEDGVPIPSFLYHPIQLIELRDVPLFKESDRPRTPLWKTYRWKAWAMKKGIIPMEKPVSEDAIRSVKVRTPFVLKTDWRDSSKSISSIRKEISGAKLDEEEGSSAGGARPSFGFSPPPAPPTSAVAVDVYCRDLVPAAATTAPIPAVGSTLPVVDIDPKKVISKEKKTSVAKQDTGSIAGSAGGQNKKHEVAFTTTADAEEWLGEEDEEMDEMMDNTLISGGAEEAKVEAIEETAVEVVEEAVETVPTVATGTLWFGCDSFASSIRKFCKFYSSRSTFGSCFILRRNADWDYSYSGTTTNEPAENNATSLLHDISDYNAVQGSHNLTIKFDMFKTLTVSPFHLDHSEGIDSAFYLFSDCWTEQEIMITIEVLQDLAIEKFTERAFNPGGLLEISKNDKMSMLNLKFVLEQWDWRNYCCTDSPLIFASTDSNYSTHLTLPAGRNTFRIWLIEEVSRDSGSGDSKDNLSGIVPFTAKFVSKTPIHVGTREEIQNYMTNEPVLFLKQCERLAQNIWTMFLLFGSTRTAYAKNLRNLRKSYCPSYSEPNIINKRLKGVHGTFEIYFVSMIIEMNQGNIDRLMLLALKCLLLNPIVGQRYGSANGSRGQAENRKLGSLLESYRKREKLAAVTAAVVKIQKYCRGWMVRRLFQIRTKGHKLYPRIEYQIRRIALILAENTDSAFGGQPTVTVKRESHPKEKFSEATDDKLPLSGSPHISPPPTVIPNPPKWAINMLRHLLRAHPLLISVHPHAYCIPHHTKIREIQGALPLNQSTSLPFVRQLFFVPGESMWCMIEIQVYPADGALLKIINNDTQIGLETSTNQMFVGKILSNTLGYTMMGYRWGVETDSDTAAETEMNEEQPSGSMESQWKIRIISPTIQESLIFEDEPPSRRSTNSSSCESGETGESGSESSSTCSGEDEDDTGESWTDEEGQHHGRCSPLQSERNELEMEGEESANENERSAREMNKPHWVIESQTCSHARIKLQFRK